MSIVKGRRCARLLSCKSVALLSYKSTALLSCNSVAFLSCNNVAFLSCNECVKRFLKSAFLLINVLANISRSSFNKSVSFFKYILTLFAKNAKIFVVF
jgi:hypothetical protein